MVPFRDVGFAGGFATVRFPPPIYLFCDLTWAQTSEFIFQVFPQVRDFPGRTKSTPPPLAPFFLFIPPLVPLFLFLFSLPKIGNGWVPPPFVQTSPKPPALAPPHLVSLRVPVQFLVSFEDREFNGRVAAVSMFPSVYGSPFSDCTLFAHFFSCGLPLEFGPLLLYVTP